MTFEIKAGQLYRRVSTGVKLMALEPYHDGAWRFWHLGGNDAEIVSSQFVEPWTEPEKLVTWYRVCAGRDAPGTQWIFVDYNWCRTREDATAECVSWKYRVIETKEIPA